MAENILTTTENIPPAVAVTYERVLLQPPTPYYIYSKYGKKTSIARKSGNQIKFREYARLSARSTPVTEGITPSPDQQTTRDILATLSQYMGWIMITDIIDMTVEDNVIVTELDRQNDQVNNTLDQLCRDYLCATASSTTCSHGSGTATLLNRTDIDAVVATLRADDARFMYGMLKASTGQGTAPIKASYRGLADTVLEDDLEDVTGFLGVESYGNSAGVPETEYGATGAIRWETSTNGYSSGSNYYCPILAKDAFAVVDLKGGNLKGILKGFGSGGTSDPGNQRASLAWKFTNAVRILQDLYIHVLICTDG